MASASAGEARPGGAAPLPWGLLAAVGIDLVIDGMLVGLGATLGSKQGLVLTVALTIEILFLAVSVVAQLLEQGQRRARAAQLAGCLGLLTAVGALAGAVLLGGASRTTLAAVLAFGAAALLYLVVEELLVEAHETDETPLLAAASRDVLRGVHRPVRDRRMTPPPWPPTHAPDYREDLA